MTIAAAVGFCRNEFIAVLGDGRQIERPDLVSMAHALVHAGVRADAVHFEWQTGQRLLTAGQKVALCAEMHRLAKRLSLLPTTQPVTRLTAER
jgi:hypothetical protein